jgi:hypothetical protein
MRKLYIPSVAILAFSYPLTTALLLVLKVPLSAMSLFNYGIKGLVTAVFGLAMAFSIAKRNSIVPTLIPLFALFGIFGVRLLYDVIGLDIVPPLSSASYILLYFFGLTVLPVLSIAFSFEPEDMETLHKWMFWTLVLTNIALFYYVLSAGDLAAENTLAYRFQVSGQDDATSVLNPITISLMGSVLLLFVVGRFAAFSTMSPLSQGGHLVVFAVGLANMLLGGSRGPVVAFVFGLIFVAASALKGSSSRPGQFKIRPRVWIYLGLMMAGGVMVALFSDLTIAAFDRFRTMFDGSGSRIIEERDYIAAAAWDDFTKSPVIGYSYITMNGTALAHNVFLESFMALGVIGGGVYLLCLFIILKGIWNGVTGRFGPYGYSVSLAAAALLALSMTSGSIGQSPEIWGMVALNMSMAHIQRRRDAGPSYRGQPVRRGSPPRAVRSPAS